MNRITLNNLLLDTFSSYGEKTALKCRLKDEEQEVTYAELYKKILKLANFMTAKGWKKRKIGILGDNSPQLMTIFFAVIVSENSAVFFDKTARGKALSEEIELSDCEIFICDKLYIDFITDINKTDNIFTFEYVLSDSNDEDLHEEKILKQRIQADINSANDIALVLFSSGTTGRQKAVMITREHLKERFTGLKAAWIYPEENLLALPFYHAYGMNVAMGMLLQGKCIYICTSQKYFWRDVKDRKCSMICLVPSQAQLLLDNMDKYKEKIPLTAIMLASAKVDLSLKVRMKEHGILHIAHYGSSETCIVSVGVEEKITSGFCGHITDGTMVNIMNADEFGRGEILVKTAGCFSTYLKDEEETKKVFIDGWIHTGDIGYIDADNMLYITGRSKNVIILPNGEKISPEMMEEKLMTVNGITECQVKEKDGHVVAEIFAENADNQRDKIKTEIKGINANLPIYQQIGEIVFRNEPFEKTSLGKQKR